MFLQKFKIPLIILAAGIVQGCVNDKEPQGADLKVGDPLPQFSVNLSDDSFVSTDELIGKVPVILFFNTSCPDCREILPEFQIFYEEMSDNPLFCIFAISRAQDSDSVKRYWTENNLTIPYSAQTSNNIYLLFASSIIPRIYIANQRGIITDAFGDTDMPDASILESAAHNALINY